MRPAKMKTPNKPIDLKSMARIVEVDNRFPLHYYYRIADNLLRQASIYREENNILDLYLMLLRYTSLVTETIPRHRDYQVLASRQRISSKKKAVAVIDELESIKPEALRIVEELNNDFATTRQSQLDGPERNDFGLGTSSLDWSANSAKTVSSHAPASLALQSSWNYGNGHAQASFPIASIIDNQLQKLSLSRPPPNKETLSRHSFLGTNGFSGWTGPSTEVKVQYPSSSELALIQDSRLNQAGQCDNVSVDGAYSGGSTSPMESVLSLDDGRWFHPAEEFGPSMGNLLGRDRNFQLPCVRQPSPPPVLAEMKQEYCAIPPSKVADPRPGVAKASQDGISNSYQHLHIPVKMMDDFLRLARENTKKNLETCGVLAGSLKNRVFHITTLIIPKQEATSDSCQTLKEEEIYDVQEKLSLFPLGWIHTHPSQSCFMSSVDLHTHYSYQIMLPEAIAIVMAPTDTSSPHGIFHLSDPSGVTLIRNCQNRGFHPHDEPEDGSPIYEHCSHVYMNPKLKFEVIDLR